MRICKKGFTVVELVIVIAVIAILAVTFTSFISFVITRANYSADVQIVRDMNPCLRAENIGDYKVDSIEKARGILQSNGYGDKFSPKSEGYGYYWCETDNTVYLVKEDGFEAEYPNTETDIEQDDCEKLADGTATEPGGNNDNDDDNSGDGGTSCLAAGTEITLADGSVKNIEDVAQGDMVLTFNHEQGCYEGQAVYLAWQCEVPACAFTLHFTNGIDISVVGDHDFFEQERMCYVAIFEEEAEAFVGRHFYNAAAGRYEELLSVTHETEPVAYYEIYTEYNANCIAEGMLNVAYDTAELLNIYKFNSDLTVDRAQLAADIAAFGLYEYPADAAYSKELFDALGWKYVNLMVGKGFGTMEDFVARRDAFLAER